MDDKDLVARIQDGDMGAFEELVRKYQHRIYAICLNMMHHEYDAADAAQECMIRVYRSIASFRGQSGIYTWMVRIATNICLDKLRASKPTSDIDSELSLASDDCVEENYERKERVRAVRDAIAQLPIDMRDVIVLRDIEGYSYEEVGRILQLEGGTVKSRLFRARDKLREILRKSGNISIS